MPAGLRGACASGDIGRHATRTRVRRRVPSRHIATWLALAGSVALALLFVVLRATTPSDGARISFYGDAWSPAGVLIAPIDAPAEGLQDGDLVVVVDGRTLETWLGDATDRSAARPVAAVPIPYEVVRSEQPQSVEVIWTVPASGATLLAGWSVILFSVSVAAVAAFVFVRRPDEPAATALVLGACGAAGSSVPWFMGTTVSDIVEGSPFIFHSLLTGPLYMVLWPAGLHLALVFPTPRPGVTRHRWLVPGVYAGALGAYAVAMVAGRIAMPSNLAWVGTWPIAQVAVVVPALTLSLALFVQTYRRATDPAARTKIRWAWLGVVTSGTIGLIGFMIPALLFQQTLLPESWIGLTAMPLPLGLAAGVLRDRLFDIDVVIRRTFVYGGLTLGVVASYVLVASGITALVGSDHGFGVSLFATGVAALIALPLRDALQRGVNRLLYGERDEPWRAIRRLGQRLDLAVDPERIFPTIVETVADALRAPFVELEVVDDVGRSSVVAKRGSPQDATVTLPLVYGSERVGGLVLGIRYGEHGFRPDEMDLLEDLARQAGAAIHALRLRADLARSHERLVLAREEERRRLRHDLHDGLGPSLAAIGLRAEASAELLDSDPVAAKHLLDELGADVQTTLADLRRLVDGLRPPALDELGLLGAIEQQAARLEGSSGSGPATTITVAGSPVPLPELPAAVEVAAYRIAVEALTNAVRHAEARTCRVTLEAGELLVIEVVDDGRGVPTTVTPGTGLESMEARAAELGGSLRIDRRRGGGTRLEARLPIAGTPVPPVAPMDGATELAGP
jgi:signal transduction histidine kinase